MEPILKVENLVKRYAKRNLVGAPQDFLALDNVSFTLPAGTTLAIVGESGSGKSTLASCVACLETATAGNLWFGGLNLARATENELRTLRPQIQLTFPDPASPGPRGVQNGVGRRGKSVERGPAAKIPRPPASEATRQLLAAVLLLSHTPQPAAPR